MNHSTGRSVCVVSPSNVSNQLETSSEQQRGIMALLHKSPKLHFLTLSRRVPPAATLITNTWNLYLAPASRYVGSTLSECGSSSSNNGVRVHNDKAESLRYDEHTVTSWGFIFSYGTKEEGDCF